MHAYDDTEFGLNDNNSINEHAEMNIIQLMARTEEVRESNESPLIVRAGIR